MAIKKVSVSGINVYAECPRKYMFQYIDRKYRVSNQHFIFGTTGHKILEMISDGFDDEVIYTFISIQQEKRSIQEALNALKITNLEALTRNYIKVYREFLETYTIIDTELMLEDKDNKGVLDLLVVDPEQHKLVIIDDKFTNMPKTGDDIINNLQLYMYAKLLEKYPKIKSIMKKYQIRNVYLGYFNLSKVEIGPPRMLASGKLSKAADKRVNYNSYLKAIKDNDLSVLDYQDHLDKLKNKSAESIAYHEAKLTRADEKEKTAEIAAWTKLINYSIKHSLFPGRNAFHCSKGGFMGKPCEIYKQCKNNL